MGSIGQPTPQEEVAKEEARDQSILIKYQGLTKTELDEATKDFESRGGKKDEQGAWIMTIEDLAEDFAWDDDETPIMEDGELTKKTQSETEVSEG